MPTLEQPPTEKTPDKIEDVVTNFTSLIEKAETSQSAADYVQALDYIERHRREYQEIPAELPGERELYLQVLDDPNLKELHPRASKWLADSSQHRRDIGIED